MKRVSSEPMHVNGVTFGDGSGNGNGFADPGETIRVRLPLENYTLNPLSDATAQGVIALLVSETPGVQVRQPVGVYGSIRAVVRRCGSRRPIGPAGHLEKRLCRGRDGIP